MQNNSFDRVIISDTSCLIALTRINKLNVLKQMYNEIIITTEVAAEYKHPIPEWIIQKEVNDKNKIYEATCEELLKTNFRFSKKIQEQARKRTIRDDSVKHSRGI